MNVMDLEKEIKKEYKELRKYIKKFKVDIRGNEYDFELLMKDRLNRILRKYGLNEVWGEELDRLYKSYL